MGFRRSSVRIAPPRPLFRTRNGPSRLYREGPPFTLYPLGTPVSRMPPLRGSTPRGPRTGASFSRSGELLTTTLQGLWSRTCGHETAGASMRAADNSCLRRSRGGTWQVFGSKKQQYHFKPGDYAVIRKTKSLEVLLHKEASGRWAAFHR